MVAAAGGGTEMTAATGGSGERGKRIETAMVEGRAEMGAGEGVGQEAGRAARTARGLGTADDGQRSCYILCVVFDGVAGVVV